MAYTRSRRFDRWEIIGPGGGGGQFIPTVSPHDPDVALIACDMTGAYITVDGGRNWRQFNLRTRVSTFAFDPSRPDIVYAGSVSAGVFRSDDRGKRWRLVFPNPGTVTGEIMVGDHSSNIWETSDPVWPGASRVDAIRIDRGRPDHVYAALSLTSGLDKGTSVICLSRDGGESWEQVCRIPGEAAHEIWIDPTASGDQRRLIVFTSAGVYECVYRNGAVQPLSLPIPDQLDAVRHARAGMNPDTGNPIFYIAGPARWEGTTLVPGVWRSIDEGRTWTSLSSIVSDRIAGPETGRLPEFTLLGASAHDARTVYAGAAAVPEIPEESGAGTIIPYWGFLKSTDAGDTWEWVFRSEPNRTAPNLRGGWVENNYSPAWNGIGPKGIAPLGIGVCDTDPNVVYATDMGASYRTTDGGRTWEQLYADEHPDGSVSSRGLDVTTCYGVHFDPFDPEHLVVSYTDIGLFHSWNGGRSWHHAIEGISPEWGNTCYWFVFDPDVRGRGWGAWGYAHDLPRPKMFRSGMFYKFQGGVAKTEDGLRTWRKSNRGMPDNSVTTHLVLDPSTPPGSRTLYAAVFDRGVYKSTDDGASWEPKNNGITSNFNAWRLVMLPDSSLYLLVARGMRRGQPVDGAVYRSRDGAESWQRVRLPDGVNAPNDLAYDPANPQRLYLACWPTTIGGREYAGGVYASDDGGESWTCVFDESKHVYGIAADPDSPSTLYINTFDNGAYRSDDGGASWRRLKGYTFKWGHAPFLDPHRKDRLYLTTFGSSVWVGPRDGDDEAFEDLVPVLMEQFAVGKGAMTRDRECNAGLSR